MLKKLLIKLKLSLEKINDFRDQALFIFIRPYWPRQITPNNITYVRFFIGFLLFSLLFIFKNDDKALILSFFIIGALTDILDGSVARGLNKTTQLGAVLDSTADRILLIPIAVYSLYNINLGLLIILALVEITNAIFSLYFKSKEIYLEADIYGKTKMVLFCVAFVAILVFWPNTPPKIFIYTLWLTIAFSFLSILSKISEFKKSPSLNITLQNRT